MRRPLVSLLAVPLAVALASAQPTTPVPALTGVRKSSEVRINGELLSRSVVVAGRSDGSTMDQVYVPLEDIARAVNGAPLLEPALRIDGNRLLISAVSGGDATGSDKLKERKISNKTTDQALKYEPTTRIDAGSKDAAKLWLKRGDELKMKQRANPALWKWSKVDAAGIAVRSTGVISSDVRMFEGKAYIPLADVARAFGGEARLGGGSYQVVIP
ncbi:MAG: hypothetical protein ACR2OG_09850 [Gemmatimonadaceae bacterium]